MIRTVVAFENENSQAKIVEMLEKSGIAVRYRCHTGMEIIRAIKSMGGGVVICGYKLLDMTAVDIAYELHDCAAFLVVAKPTLLSLIEDEDTFKLATPVNIGELGGSVRMLIQMDQKHSNSLLPKRTEQDIELIRIAKQMLMERNNMTEQEAHKFMQRKSMMTSSKMTDTAQLIIETFERV